MNVADLEIAFNCLVFRDVSDVILGRDWMTKHDDVLDLKRKSLTVHGRTLSLTDKPRAKAGRTPLETHGAEKGVGKGIMNPQADVRTSDEDLIRGGLCACGLEPCGTAVIEVRGGAHQRINLIWCLTKSLTVTRCLFAGIRRWLQIRAR